MAKHGGHLALHIFYAFCLLLTAALLSASSAAPFWVVDNSGSFVGACGIFSYCNGTTQLDCDIHIYGTSIDSFPNTSTRNTAGLLVFCAIVCWLSALVSLITCCACYSCTKYQAPALVVVVIFLLATILYFAYSLTDFGTAANHPFCNCGPDVSNFQPGDCTFGYATYFVIASVVVTAFTAFIAYRVMRRDITEGLYE